MNRNDTLVRSNGPQQAQRQYELRTRGERLGIIRFIHECKRGSTSELDNSKEEK
jgi:hypothetical protein